MTDDQTSTPRSKSVLENLTIAVTALATALFLGGCAAATETAHQQTVTHTTTAPTADERTGDDLPAEATQEPKPIFITPIHAEPHRDSPVVGEIADPNCFDLDPGGNPTPAPVDPDIYGGLWHQTEAGWVLNTGFCH